MHLSGKPDDGDGRQNLEVVVEQDQGNAEDVAIDVSLQQGVALKEHARGIAAGHRDEVRVDKDRANGHGEHRLEAELLACRPGDDDGEELEGGVAGRIEHGVGCGSLELRNEGADERQNRDDEAAGHQDAQNGLEDLGDGAEEAGERIGLLTIVLAGICRYLAALVHRIGCDELVVDSLDHRADDDLVLAALLHDVEDALRGLETLGVADALVLEPETKTGDAVRQALDVVKPTDTFKDRGVELFVLSHGMSFL